MRIMSTDKTTPQPPNSTGKSRALEDALRANLLKRKQQQRARTQNDTTVSPPNKDKT